MFILHIGKSYQTCPWQIEEEAIQGLLWGMSPQADLFAAASTHDNLPSPSISFLPGDQKDAFAGK